MEKQQEQANEVAIETYLSTRPLQHDLCRYALARWQCWPLSVAFYTWWAKTESHKHLMEMAASAVFQYAGMPYPAALVL